jgi:hypothetical protein
MILFGSAANAQQFIYGNSAGNGMYKIDKTTGAVVATCPQGKGNGRGMVVVGNVAYFTVADSGNIYKTNFTTCSDDGIAFTVPGVNGIATIAFDGTNFWVGDYTGPNRAFLVSPTGTLLSTITLANCTNNCDGLEFYQGKLISNRGDALNPGNYDVYSTAGTLLTPGFISATPFSVTGIAFDGTNFYVSDIFNQRLQVYNGTTGAFIQTINITGMTLSNVIEDLSADYSITLGPASTEIPTLQQWALITLSVLLALVGLGMTARRRR